MRKYGQMDAARRAAYGGQEPKQKQPCYGSLIINRLSANILYVGGQLYYYMPPNRHFIFT
jgi:hypothetical protein